MRFPSAAGMLGRERYRITWARLDKIPIAARDGNRQLSGAPSLLRGFILVSDSERLIKLNLESRKINIPTSSLVISDHCNSRFSHVPRQTDAVPSNGLKLSLRQS